MRFIFGIIAAFICLNGAAQGPAKKDTAAKKIKLRPDFTSLNLKNRPNDHFMMQFGYDGWASAPDSIRTRGFSRHFNIYVMYDMPFKTNPQWSVAIGGGLGTSHIFLENTSVKLTGTSANAQAYFVNVADTNHFKKYKLANTWLEVPVELRWLKNPANPNGSFKIVLGAKIGTLMSAYTKGKNLETKDGKTVYGTSYIEKQKEKSFLNSTRLAFTLRLGFGAASLFGSYQVIRLFKDNKGPSANPYSIGFCLSGL